MMIFLNLDIRNTLHPLQKVKKLKKEYYEEYEDISFGNEFVSSLQLLSMTDKKDENGYYKCLIDVSFTEDNKIIL